MHKVSRRINNLSESQTIAMSQKSRELIAEGKDIINLSLGEPDFNTPDFIKRAAKEAIDNNFSSYPPVAGYQELREAISLKFKRDNQLTYEPDQIVVSTGAKQSLANVILSIVNPGDEVIIPSPYWVSYLELIKLAEGIPVFIEGRQENDFKITAEQLKEKLSEKTKLMVYSSPSNPTGSIYSKQELSELAEVIAKKEDFYVISDEIYEHINFIGKHESIAQFPSIYEQIITVNGLSKAFAMTGWRLGYIGAAKWIAKACNKMQGQITSGANSITQRAAIAALNASADVTYEMKDAFEKRRNLVVSRLQSIEKLKINIPEGAFYVFPDVSAYFGSSYRDSKIKNASDLCMFLLEHAEVATVTGEAFGSPNFIRISYATSEEALNKAIDRIEKSLDLLTF